MCTQCDYVTLWWILLEPSDDEDDQAWQVSVRHFAYIMFAMTHSNLFSFLTFLLSHFYPKKERKKWNSFVHINKQFSSLFTNKKIKIHFTFISHQPISFLFLLSILSQTRKTKHQNKHSIRSCTYLFFPHYPYSPCNKKTTSLLLSLSHHCKHYI